MKAWATVSMTKLNENKTNLMLVTSKGTKHLLSLHTSLTIGNAEFHFKQSVNNIGLPLNSLLNMNEQNLL